MRLRRALGFKLERAGRLLPQWCRLPGGRRRGDVTSDLANRLGAAARAYPAQPLGTAPGHRPRVCPLPAGARPGHEVPPPGVFPTRRHRPTPFLWSQRESAVCCRAPERCAQLCGRRPNEALLGCSPPAACGWARRSASTRDDADLRAGVNRDPHAKVRPHQAVRGPTGHRDLSRSRPSVIFLACLPRIEPLQRPVETRNASCSGVGQTGDHRSAG